MGTQRSIRRWCDGRHRTAISRSEHLRGWDSAHLLAPSGHGRPRRRSRDPRCRRRGRYHDVGDVDADVVRGVEGANRSESLLVRVFQGVLMPLFRSLAVALVVAALVGLTLGAQSAPEFKSYRVVIRQIQ